jgi:hypothetical protein
VKTLPFNVAPAFLEDLGLNLYTSLDKVLVEFIANAHDADASHVTIDLDVVGIDGARKTLKERWRQNSEAAKALGADPPEPLETCVLEDIYKITITDDGTGMSEADLTEKFLQVSRRKRTADGSVSHKGRAFMGRKGLGKLAGFGVAQKIVVTSLKEGESTATRITLDYNELKKFKSMNDVTVPCENLSDKGGIVSDHGTIIELTRLVYAGLKGSQETALRHAVECFWMLDAKDFKIMHGSREVKALPRPYEWAYPADPKRTDDQLHYELVPLAGGDYGIWYRIRFTRPKGQLKSHEYGVRVYAHSRLAAVPSLFEVTSSSNGYKYTSYMDGVVVADFIDEQQTDYIGTNRQGLRWETPLLADLHKFIHDKIKDALNQFSNTKDSTLNEKVTKHEWTKETIGAAKLPAHREKLAFKIAVVLAHADGDEVEGRFYRKSLPIIVQGLSRGDILKAIADLSAQDSPELEQVARQITELTKQEFGDFLAIVQGRLDGITALQTIYKAQDFKGPDKEKELQALFEDNPWLIDPTYFQFMSADETQASFNDRLSKHLGVGSHAKVSNELSETEPYGTNKRPDLTFVLGNATLQKVVIVELKAPNTPLHHDHFIQLKDYMRRTKDHLKSIDGTKGKNYVVQGLLIGTRAPSQDMAREKVRRLADEEEERPQNANWEVLSIGQVLDRTKDAHKELLEAHERAKRA